MKKLLLLLSVSLLIVVLLAGCGGLMKMMGMGAGTIRGTVIDENNQPVVGAVITTDPPTESTMSSYEGFVIQGVPVGVYRVRAAKDGYSTTNVEIRVQRKKVTQADLQIRSLK